MAYNPGNWNVYAQGLANLSGGISEGSSGVAAGLKDWSQKKDLTRSLRGMFSAVDPENKDMYESMGLPELQGKLQSYSLQHTLGALKQQKEQLDMAERLKGFQGDVASAYSSPTVSPESLKQYSGPLTALPTIPGPGGIPAVPNPDFWSAIGGAPAPQPAVKPAPPGLAEIAQMGMKRGVPMEDIAKTLQVYGAIQPKKPVQIPEGTRINNVKVNDRTGDAEYEFTAGLPVGPAGSEIKLPSGGTLFSDGKEWKIKNTEAGAKPPTEAQAKANSFADRMAFNNDVLEKLSTGGFDATSGKNVITSRLPNMMKPADRQAWDTAKSNWTTAALRQESGAAISAGEYSTADKEYFPQPGDSADVVKQKSALRKLAEENIRKAAGMATETKGSETTKQAAPLPMFKDEAQARTSGRRSGDEVMLYDPKTATYRPVRLN